MTLYGKTISILGDSISTFADISSGKAADRTKSTIRNNDVYYTNGRWGVTLEKTWWMRVIQSLGLRLLVNNSWSGSCILREHHGTVGTYVDRCVQLHCDVGEYADKEPDLIAVFMGTNDFTFYRNVLGAAADIDYSRLIQKTDRGYEYETPCTTCEALAVTLHKMRVRYPRAEIFCMNLLPRRAENAENIPQPTQFNADIFSIATELGCHIVDLYHCGIPTNGEDFDQYFPDQRVHPNTLGMAAIANQVVSDIEKHFSKFEK